MKLKQGNQQLGSIAWRLLKLQVSDSSLTSSAQPSVALAVEKLEGHRGKKKALTKTLFHVFSEGDDLEIEGSLTITKD